MENSLTILYLTANKLSREWLDIQQDTLKRAAGESSIIAVSREAIDFGDMNLIDTEKQGYINIYRQMLRAAKLATTEYVAMAEDDVLYSMSHFEHRPRTISYNMHRWALFSWGDPIYSMRDRVSNCSMIAKRDYLIEALEERFAKYPGETMPLNLCGEVGRNKLERNLGITERQAELVYSDVSIVQINHILATEDRQKRMRKNYGKVKAYDIPLWGEAKNLQDMFNENL